MCGAVGFVVAFAATAVARLGIPAPLTDVRLGTLQHVQRVLDRQPLYGVPTAAFVPLAYPPIYYYASAVAAALIGNGYAALRLTSLLSTFATFALAATWTRHETGSWWAGVLAAGLYAATYRMTDAWFDVERVDALYVALLIAGLYVLRRSATTAGAAAAGFLFLLSALTKQSAWVMAGVLAIFLVAHARRRGLMFSATIAGGALASTALLTALAGRWYAFFVFGIGAHRYTLLGQSDRWLPSAYDVIVREVILVVPFALLLVIWRFASGPRGFFTAAWCGTLAAALLTRLVQDSRVNVMMPVYAVTAVMTAVAAWDLLARARGSSNGTPRLVVLALCVAQFAILAYVPWHLLQPFPGSNQETVLAVGGAEADPRVTTRMLAWNVAWRTPHADVSATADFFAFAPPEVGRRFSDDLIQDLCLATRDRPFVVSALLFDRDWQETMASEIGRPLPLPATIDAAVARCGEAAVH